MAREQQDSEYISIKKCELNYIKIYRTYHLFEIMIIAIKKAI